MGYPNKGDLDQSRQVDVGLEDTDELAELDALTSSAEKNMFLFPRNCLLSAFGGRII